MPQTVDSALKEAVVRVDEAEYALVTLPPGAILPAAAVVAELGEAFAALIADASEVTLVLPDDALDAYTGRLPGARVADDRYRLITLDVALEPGLVGFMARVSAALAGAGVSILPLAAFTRDHLLVPAAQVDTAVAALERLQA